MRRVLITSVSVIAIAIVGFFVYSYIKNQDSIEVWDLIPESSIVVYEAKDFGSTWNNILNTDIWKNASHIPSIKEFNEELKFLDSMAGFYGNFNKNFAEKPIHTSFHPISRDEFGYILYMNMDENNSRKALLNIIKKLESSEGYTISRRTYLNKRINEINNENNSIAFSFIENYFILSHTSFLIEDVIRELDYNTSQNFQKNHSELFDAARLDNDQGNIYIDANQFGAFYKTFSSINDTSEARINQFCQSIFFDVKIENDVLLLNGTCFAPSDNPGFFINTMRNQSASKSQINSYIPLNAGEVLTYSFNDMTGWQNNLERFWEANVPRHLINRRNFTVLYNYNIDDLLSWAGSEIALITTESLNPQNPHLINLIKSRDNEAAQNTLKELAKLSVGEDDTVFHENYGTFEIVQLKIEELPKTLFGAHFKGFPGTFYTIMDDYVVFSNDIQGLKSFISEINTENTWPKSIKFNLFFEL